MSMLSSHLEQQIAYFDSIGDELTASAMRAELELRGQISDYLTEECDE